MNHSLFNHDKVQKKQATPEPQTYHNFCLQYSFLIRRRTFCIKFLFLINFQAYVSFFLSLYYIHFEITGGPCYLIGSRWCNLFMNCTIFALNRIFFQANEQATLKTKQPIRFQGLFRVTNQIAGNERQSVSCGKFCNFCFQNSYFFPLKMDKCNFKPVQNCINKIFELTKSYIWVISKWI